MNSTLKWTRIVLAGLILILCLGIFIGGETTAPVLAKYVLAFQFVPALLKLVSGGGALAALGVFVILALTLLFGRVYCACMCPLGILQDTVRFLSRRFPPLRRFQNRQNNPLGPRIAILRYTVLLTTVICAILGSFVLLNQLEPYSIFGRITTHLFRPVAAYLQLALASILERADIYVLSESSRQAASTGILILTFLFALMLTAMAALKGRLYCNSICPVGTLLGIIAQFSRWGVQVDSITCTACGLCARKCRANCIKLNKDGKPIIDRGQCVNCFDCLTLCPVESLSFGRKYHTQNQTEQQPEAPALPAESSRRNFLLTGSGCLACAAAVPARSIVADRIPTPHLCPVTPSGARNVEHFTNACTACHLCVRACPTGVIKPSLLGYGLRGMMQPALSYADGYCEYDCTICSDVCPNGAIQPVSTEKKRLIKLGTAELDETRCVVYLRDEECGACAEVCPTHAVYTEEQNGILYPKVREAPCIGCGACQYVCPQTPRAITVKAMPIHEKATPPFAAEPRESPPEPTPEMQNYNEFPF